MNIIIFSKDRGCQLELFLRSMKTFFKEWSSQKINILYKYSNNKFSKSYDITKKIHPEFNYKLEKNFKKDLLSLLDKNDKYSVFFVDDNIFKEDFSINDDKFKFFENEKNIICLSLRLHPELNYCYPAKVKMTKPSLNENNVFDWRGKSGDFGYPMSLDGHIFRTNEIFPLIVKLNYHNPNSLESKMSITPIKKPFMIMYDKSVIINNPVNKVQNFNQNIHGNISANYLNEEFLKGKRIVLDKYKGFNNKSCHQEIDIIFE